MAYKPGLEEMVTISELHTIYKGKKIFVTGHTGFKGSWLIQILHAMGAIVKGYALEPETSHDLYLQIKGDSFCDSVISDIRDIQSLHNEITAFEPDFIFHLAAQPLVRKSYHLPHYTYEVNVMGTVHLLEVLRMLEHPCTAVFVTTDKVYENMETGKAYAEDEKLGGYDPYSSSKAASEIAVASYRNSFFNPFKVSEHQKNIASARAGNVIGGGDYAQDRIIPDIIRALQAGEPILLRNPSAVRPWQHVLEPLGGYLLLGAYMHLNPGKYTEAFNFGPRIDDVLTVQQLADEAIEIYGKGSFQYPEQMNQPHEAGLLSLDIAKAESVLGWQPLWNAKEAIKYTIQWYFNEADATTKCLNEIRQYFSI